MDTSNLRRGIYGGLAGGLLFGAMLGMMGMLPMIGQMIGLPNAFAGFALHMVNSAIIGAAFAFVFGKIVTEIRSGLLSGVVYGVAWWLLGPLTLMPLFMGMGMGVNWNLSAAAAMLPSLAGHVLYGLVLGAVYALGSERRLAYAAASSR